MTSKSASLLILWHYDIALSVEIDDDTFEYDIGILGIGNNSNSSGMSRYFASYISSESKPAVIWIEKGFIRGFGGYFLNVVP
ncbi:hypothetical protein Ddc_10377 [Ditylenchus destructor]|nr:hypothetical protein Ddc_10377 [Ditylenchus destructor]